MTVGSESHWETTNTNREALNTAKTKIKIGFWNVRTMYAIGKLAQVTAEMRRYNLHVLGVSESRWTDSGKIRTTTGETLLYSGREDGLHHEGVAIILKKGIEKSLMEWKPINSRLLTVRLRGKQVNMTLFQCYAPTNDADEEHKNAFYEQLQQELDNTPDHDIKIIMGDMNAKVGADNELYNRAMGRHGCGSMNENGERLVEFCTTNNYVIGGTLFPHQNIHKLTWHSPNMRDKNQIDHIMINGKWRRSLLDVRVKRGADVDSDHHLVTATIKLKLRSTERKNMARKKFDVDKLKDIKVRHEFNIMLKNKFDILQNLEPEDNIHVTSIDKKWEKISNIYTETGEKCIGYRQKHRSKDWIMPRTWIMIDSRRDAKKKVNEAKSLRLKERHQREYSEIEKEVKKALRADKRAHIDDLATKAEEAANRGEQGTLYKITKALNGRNRPSPNLPVKDKTGKLLSSKQEMEERWTEHFKEILNRPPPTHEPDISYPANDLNISIEPPQIPEIVSAIQSLKNGKAPGYDNLNAELFKTDPLLTATILQPIFHDIWERNTIPDEWNHGVIIKIPKKGNLNDCNNWRGITLLSIPSKIMAKIIIRRISIAVDVKLRKEQAGFRPGRGSFDSIHRDSLWKIVRSYGIPQHLIDIIKSFYVNFRCRVGNTSIEFDVKTGVRQGCVMSSTLFIIAIDWVMKNTTFDIQRGIRWGTFTTLEDLDFADDIALFSHSHQHIQDKTSRLHKYAGSIGLKINTKKTEVMTLNVNNPQAVKVENHILPCTNTFTYLGSKVTTDGGAETDIKERLSKARAAFNNLHTVWRSSQYTTRTKLKLYKSCILPILLYGSECWRMTESDLNKLSTFHTKSLRRILRIFWPNTISNQDLLNRCQQEDMATIIIRRRWNWLGHVLRRDSDSIIKTALFWTPEGKRKRGRPKVTWRRTVEAELKVQKRSWGTLQKLASDRQGWRTLVTALYAKGVTGTLSSRQKERKIQNTCKRVRKQKASDKLEPEGEKN
ncbi:uncharacterized protein LOC133197034 [Saccostrea echinata]|uniref:uncharacterized protein LOC133197034 n=1 Tax=Saccostrea echinata TaxID=191078 RepID=UPI002A817AD3|nr:uncharacterized protein LOC133197034 [Saccostrea echinata]